LLEAHRGRTALAVDAFCDMAARFSSLVHALGDSLQEIDVNPVIVTHDHSVAVDALVVGRKSKVKG